MATKKLVIEIELDNYPKNWFVSKIKCTGIDLEIYHDTTVNQIVRRALSAERDAVESIT